MRTINLTWEKISQVLFRYTKIHHPYGFRGHEENASDRLIHDKLNVPVLFMLLIYVHLESCQEKQKALIQASSLIHLNFLKYLLGAS